jgi:hypothetical protein
MAAVPSTCLRAAQRLKDAQAIDPQDSRQQIRRCCAIHTASPPYLSGLELLRHLISCPRLIAQNSMARRDETVNSLRFAFSGWSVRPRNRCGAFVDLEGAGLNAWYELAAKIGRVGERIEAAYQE